MENVTIILTVYFIFIAAGYVLAKERDLPFPIVEYRVDPYEAFARFVRLATGFELLIIGFSELIPLMIVSLFALMAKP